MNAARRAWAERVARSGLLAARTDGLARARAELSLVEGGGTVTAAEDLAVLLHDVRARDEVATWSLECSDAVLALAEQVARRTPPPGDAPVCALLAWVAYLRGDGARANVALERALRSDPQHALALLLQAALERAVPPGELRETLRATRRALSSPGSPSSC
jgi:hypothetical protein